jgi:NADH:ubiquinone oxidoreductase subunit E
MIDLRQEARSGRAEVDLGRIRNIVGKHGPGRGLVIAILEEIQMEYGYLPEAALRAVAEETKRPLVDIWGVASFYHAFSLAPRGRHVVSACLGTACHVRGGPTVVEEFERQLGVKVGETTPDREFTLKTVNCLGACALGPVTVIDGHYFSKMRRSRVRHLLDEARRGFDRGDGGQDPRVFRIEVGCPSCNRSLMDPTFAIEGHPSIRVTASFGDKHGWLRLSSLYGRYNVFSEHTIPLDSVVHFFCPYCHATLVSSWTCTNCEAPMVSMIVRGGGTVRICSRLGCIGSNSHMLDLF